MSIPAPAIRAIRQSIIRISDYDGWTEWAHQTRHRSADVLTGPTYFAELVGAARLDDEIKIIASRGRSAVEHFRVAVTQIIPGRGVYVDLVGKIEAVKARDNGWRAILGIHGRASPSEIATAKTVALEFVGDDKAEIDRIEKAELAALAEIGLAA
jgi:hypothetical protein